MNQVPEPSREPVVGYIHTTGFPALLQQNRFTLLVSTYQAQRVLLFSASANVGKLNMLMRLLPKPTGMAYSNGRLGICAKLQITFFRPAGEVIDVQGQPMPHDLVLAPISTHYTGDLSLHDAAYLGEQFVFVNSRFSCVAKIDSQRSFVPLWQPPFITELAPDDRCHLNGIASDGSTLRYASALAASNTPEGWRADRAHSGIIIDVPRNKIVLEGLAMPHSPRWHKQHLYFLESGTGSLCRFDPLSAQLTRLLQLPGYARGLALLGNLAFVGTCKIREKHTFGGMPIEENLQELKCALHVVNLDTRKIIEFIEFTKGIEELFEVTLIPNTLRPQLIGFEEPTLEGLFVL